MGEVERRQLVQDYSCSESVIRGPCSAQQLRALVQGCLRPQGNVGRSTGHLRESWLPVSCQHVAEGVLVPMGVVRRAGHAQ